MISPALGATLSAVGAGVAAVLAVWAMAATRHAHRTSWWRYLALVAVLSVFYVFAWTALLAVPGLDRAVWSHTVTPVSALTFFTVWTGPSILVIVTRSRIRIEAEEAGGDVD